MRLTTRFGYKLKGARMGSSQSTTSTES